MHFTIPADHGVKSKESEKKHKYSDLPWELKKICRGKMTFIISYLPTPPLGQDMTQGRFLSGV